MDSKILFVETVRAAEVLPTALRGHAFEIVHFEEARFDESYIEFLDERIRLNPRGPEWVDKLKRRRACFQPFCGVSLLGGTMRADAAEFAVSVHPETRSVVYWEECDSWEKIKRMVLDGMQVNVHLCNGKSLVGVKYIGFTQRSSLKYDNGYEILVKFRSARGTGFGIRSKSIRTIEDISHAA